MKKLMVMLCGICLSVAVMAAPNSESTKPGNVHQTQPVVLAEHSVNINTANVDSLQKVKGIGAKKAAAIVDYRMKNGNFKTVNDLTNVKGISQKLFAKISNYITI